MRVGCFSNSTNTAVWIWHKRFSNSLYQGVPYRATNSKSSKKYIFCIGLQMTFATATLTELLFYFSLPTNVSSLTTVTFRPYNRWWPQRDSNSCYRRERAVSLPLDHGAKLISRWTRTTVHSRYHRQDNPHIEVAVGRTLVTTLCLTSDFIAFMCPYYLLWWCLRDSNPCYRRERPVS